MSKYAIFLSGPIGAGKTTLGRALAEEFGGGFIDGDDHALADRPWYCSSLRISRSVVGIGLAMLESRRVVVIAYPLRRTNWIYWTRRFGRHGVGSIVVTLRASHEEITSAGRGRSYSPAESERIGVMLREGYADRPFSDVILDVGGRSFDATLRRLTLAVGRLVDSG